MKSEFFAEKYIEIELTERRFKSELKELRSLFSTAHRHFSDQLQISTRALTKLGREISAKDLTAGKISTQAQTIACRSHFQTTLTSQ